MARCEVTVEGQALVVEAKSLYYAAIEYNTAQICGFARDYPKLLPDTAITVQVVGRPEVHRITWREVMEWANRVAEEDARRWFAERAEKEPRKGR